MKKKKLKLNELKVQSFVTGFGKDQIETLKGRGLSDNPVCLSAVDACQNSVAQMCTIQLSVCIACISNVECG